MNVNKTTIVHHFPYFLSQEYIKSALTFLVEKQMHI